jgi:UrcA family protein
MNARFSQSIRRLGRHAAFAAAVCCSIALSTMAMADASDDKPLTKVVTYDDLNLNAEAGVRVLYVRLRMAASEVCAPLKSSTYRQMADWRDCFDQAITRAVKQVDQPMLTAHHLSRTSKSESETQVAKDP